MSREKQIEDMAVDLCLIDRCKYLPQAECNNTTCAHCEAEALYNAGYRKQSDGEWKKFQELYPRYVCTACNHLFNNKEYKFCPNCGAKMRKEDEGK